ncbi:MAG: DUF6125 family protein [Desulfovibrionaceae bacterium]
MDTSFLSGPEGDRRDAYLEFLLWHYQVVDAFWYINAEATYGAGAADALNEAVWGKAAQLAARRIKERFLPPGLTGLDAFAAALRHFPWAVIVGYDMRRQEDGIHISVANCPSQEGRKRHGQGEYACKGMHMAEFTAFARAIDPAIQVTCLYAPPDPHPDDCYCRWRFHVA